MGIIDLFSKRQRRLRGEFPDVYTYDDLPDTLRVQVVHIIRDAFGVDNGNTPHKFAVIEGVTKKPHGQAPESWTSRRGTTCCRR